MTGKPPPNPLFPRPIICDPGIKRDGTVLEGKNYTAGQWARFQRGRPRKIWGYRRASDLISGIGRLLQVYPFGHDIQVHIGHANGIQRVQIDENGLALGPPVDRTPVGFVADPTYLWSMDVLYNAVDVNASIFAVPVLSTFNIADETDGTIYYGDVNDTAALAALAPTDGPAAVSGGIVAVPPYLFAYGTAGYVTWSAPNDPFNFATADGGGGPDGSRIAATKVVKGVNVRGGPGTSPAALFWTLDSLIKASFQGTPTAFGFDTVSDQISVLSINTILEYDEVYYWAGIDRFFMFNGVVQELPNDMNTNYFFDNINWDVREKCFAMKIPRWGEIWFCYPRGSATECSHAVIYNKRYNIWYDTVLPNTGRSAGAAGQYIRYPLMTGVVEVASKSKLWQHEFGVDEIDGSTVTAIASSFETCDFSIALGDMGIPPENRLAELESIEPDFLLSGLIAAVITGRSYAMANDMESDPYILNPALFDPADPLTYTIPSREQRSQLRVIMTSNVVGGDYQTGDLFGWFRKGDGHR